MSIAKNFILVHELEEEFKYHREEANYHLEQYLKALDEMEGHYRQFKEHAAYRDEFSQKIKEDIHAVS